MSADPRPPVHHHRDVLVWLFSDRHHRPTADSVLNELHQHGYRVVPRADASPVDARRVESGSHEDPGSRWNVEADMLDDLDAARQDIVGAEDTTGVYTDAEGGL